jgi:hypothetical protein
MKVCCMGCGKDVSISPKLKGDAYCPSCMGESTGFSEGRGFVNNLNLRNLADEVHEDDYSEESDPDEGAHDLSQLSCYLLDEAKRKGGKPMLSK